MRVLLKIAKYSYSSALLVTYFQLAQSAGAIEYTD